MKAPKEFDIAIGILVVVMLILVVVTGCVPPQALVVSTPVPGFKPSKPVSIWVDAGNCVACYFYGGTMSCVTLREDVCTPE
jgi:hypothetical protein